MTQLERRLRRLERRARDSDRIQRVPDISNLFIPQQPLKPDGQRHAPGDPGNGVISRAAIMRR